MLSQRTCVAVISGISCLNFVHKVYTTLYTETMQHAGKLRNVRQAVGDKAAEKFQFFKTPATHLKKSNFYD